jgi:hypothetical protein
MVLADVIPGRRRTARIVAPDQPQALTLRVLGVFRNCVTCGRDRESCNRVIAVAAD